MALFESLTQASMLSFPSGLGTLVEQSGSRVVLAYTGALDFRITFTGDFEFGAAPEELDPGTLPPGFDPSDFGPGFDPDTLLPDEIQDLLDQFDGLLPDFDSFEEVRGTLTGVELAQDGSTIWQLSGLNVALGDGADQASVYSLLSVLELGLSGNDVLRGSPLEDILQGWAGDDIIEGGLGADFLMGMAGNDTISTGSLGDRVNGNEGFDTVIVPGDADAFRLTFGNGVVTLDDKLGDAAQTVLDTVERLIFEDGDGNPDNNDVIDLDIFDGISTATPEQVTNLVEMYVAYFNRAPDALGLYYWGDRLADGMTLDEIAASFFTQDETIARYPNPNDFAGLVDSVYENVLARAADPEGRAYWINELQSGLVAPGTFILNIINGAKNFNPDGATPEQIAQAAVDARILSDKADVGLYYSVFKGLGVTEGAAASMQAYNPDAPEQSLEAIRDLIDDYAQAADTAEGGASLTTPAFVPFLFDPFTAL